MTTIDQRDASLRQTIRRAIADALDAGLRGSAIIRTLQSETNRLRETVPTLTRNQLGGIADAIAGRYGE
jgi:hypothetical protein